MGLKDMLQLGNIGKTGTLLAHNQKMAAQFDIMFHMAHGFYQLSQKGYPHTREACNNILKILGEHFLVSPKQANTLFTELSLSQRQQEELVKNAQVFRKRVNTFLQKHSPDKLPKKRQKLEKLLNSLIHLRNIHFPYADNLYQEIFALVSARDAGLRAELESPHLDRKHGSDLENRVLLRFMAIASERTRDNKLTPQAAKALSLLREVQDLDFDKQQQDLLGSLHDQGNKDAGKLHDELQTIAARNVGKVHYKKIKATDDKMSMLLKKKYPRESFDSYTTTFHIGDLLRTVSGLAKAHYPQASRLYLDVVYLIREVDPTFELDDPNERDPQKPKPDKTGFRVGETLTKKIIRDFENIAQGHPPTTPEQAKRADHILRQIHNLSVTKKKQAHFNALREQNDQEALTLHSEMQALQHDFIVESHFQSMSSDPTFYQQRKNQFLNATTRSGKSTYAATTRLLNTERLNLHETKDILAIQKVLLDLQTQLLQGAVPQDEVNRILKEKLSQLWDISHGKPKDATDAKHREEALAVQISTFQARVDRLRPLMQLPASERYIKELMIQKLLIEDYRNHRRDKTPRQYQPWPGLNYTGAHLRNVTNALNTALASYQKSYRSVLNGRLPTPESCDARVANLPQDMAAQCAAMLVQWSKESTSTRSKVKDSYLGTADPILSDIQEHSIREYMIDATNIEQLGAPTKGRVDFDSVQRELLDRFQQAEDRRRSAAKKDSKAADEKYRQEVQEILASDIYHRVNNDFSAVFSQFTQSVLVPLQQDPTALARLHPHILGFFSAIQTALSTAHVFGLTPEALDIVARICSMPAMGPDNALTKFTAGITTNICHPEWVTQALARSVQTLGTIPLVSTAPTATAKAATAPVAAPKENPVNPRIQKIQIHWNKKIPKRALRKLVTVAVESGQGSLPEQVLTWCNDLVKLQSMSEALARNEISEKEISEFFRQNSQSLSELQNMFGHTIIGTPERLIAILKDPKTFLTLFSDRMHGFRGRPYMRGQNNAVEYSRSENHQYIDSTVLSYLLELNLREILGIDLGKNGRGLLLAAAQSQDPQLSLVVVAELERIREKQKAEAERQAQELKRRQEEEARQQAERAKQPPSALGRFTSAVGSGFSAVGGVVGTIASATVSTTASAVTTIAVHNAGDLILADRLYTKAGIILSGDEFRALLDNLLTQQKVALNSHSCLILSQQLQRLGIYTNAVEIDSIANTREGLAKFIIVKLGALAPKTITEQTLTEALKSSDAFANLMFKAQEEWTGIDLTMAEIQALQAAYQREHGEDAELSTVSAFQEAVAAKVAVKLSKVLNTHANVDVLPEDVRKSMQSFQAAMMAQLQPSTGTAAPGTPPQPTTGERLKVALKRKNPEPWRHETDVQSRIQTEVLCNLHEKTHAFLGQFRDGLAALLVKNKRLNQRRDLTEVLVKTEGFIAQYQAQAALKAEIEKRYQALIAENPGISLSHLLRSKPDGKILSAMITQYDQTNAQLFQDAALLVYTTAQTMFLDKDPNVASLMYVANVAICALYSVNGKWDAISQGKIMAVERGFMPDLSRQFSATFGQMGERLQPALANMMGHLANAATNSMMTSQLLFFQNAVAQLSQQTPTGEHKIKRDLAKPAASVLDAVWDAICWVLAKMHLIDPPKETLSTEATASRKPALVYSDKGKQKYQEKHAEVKARMEQRGDSVNISVEPRKHPERHRRRGRAAN